MGLLNGFLKGLGFEVEETAKDVKQDKKVEKSYSANIAKYDLKNMENKKAKEPQFFVPKNQQDIMNIVDILKSGDCVTVDMNTMTDSDFVRALDFLSGAVYSLDGKIKKIKDKVFFFCPKVD